MRPIGARAAGAPPGPRTDGEDVMIKVSVMYPSGAGSRFDMGYYTARHMRLVQDELGGALKGISVDRGLDSPDSPAPNSTS